MVGRRLPGRADKHDREKFDKLRNYLLRVDEHVTCKTCGKKFEIPSQHSLLFVDDLEGFSDEEIRVVMREAGCGLVADSPL